VKEAGDLSKSISTEKRAVAGAILFLAVLGTAPLTAAAQDGPRFPTTVFAEGETNAAVTVGDVTATVSQTLRPDIDPNLAVPILEVAVKGEKVLEVPGVASGMDFVAAEASIAEIDPNNDLPEVYFTSYSGGAHCCNMVIVASLVDGAWTSVNVGEFDGDGNYLDDLDDDGVAEIVTVDNRFLYTFDCYACSAAPLTMTTVRHGEVVDISTEPRFLPAHRDWLAEIETHTDDATRWQSRGYLAGWMAAKIRVGEGDEAWRQLSANWNAADDPGEEVCVTGEELEDCPRQSRATLKFPARLKLFLEQTGYL